MKPFFTVMIVGGIFGLMGMTAHAESNVDAPPSKMECRTLLNTSLKIAQGNDVIVDHVTAPPNTTLPKHWHPGETFVYVLKGSVVLWQEGEAETVSRKGDVIAVPLKKIHSARTTDEGAEVLVFRVHEEGKPVRVSVK